MVPLSRTAVLLPSAGPAPGLVSMVPQEGCCLGPHHQAINDSSKSGRVNGRAYGEGRVSGGVATRDKQGWHCVSKIEYFRLITERETSPLGRDSMGSTWKSEPEEPESPTQENLRNWRPFLKP